MTRIKRWERWTEEERAVVQRMTEAGEPDHVIGAELGRTATAVTNFRLRRAGQRKQARRGRPTVWPPERVAKARALWEKRWSARRIAREFGVSERALWRVVDRFDFPKRPKDAFTKASKHLVKKLSEIGCWATFKELQSPRYGYKEQYTKLAHLVKIGAVEKSVSERPRRYRLIAPP